MNTSTIRQLLESVFALLGLVLVSPFLSCIALAIKLDDRGSIFFRQQRVGQYGRCFTLFKFRSLATSASYTNTPECYVTRVGRVLRQYALDELPQLWNVVRGEMSLVGPRPILPEEAQQYDPWQAQRLQVLPGLTGWAQINGRNALAWHERIAHDVWYVQQKCWQLDVQIALRTPSVLLRREGVYGPGNHDPNAAAFRAYRAHAPPA